MTIKQYQNPTIELNKEEISPSSSNSSPDTLELLMKAEGRLIVQSGENGSYLIAINHQSRRLKASTILMQLISYESISFKDCGLMHDKDQRFNVIVQIKIPRVIVNQVIKEVDSLILIQNGSNILEGLIVGELKIRSISVPLVETKKYEIPALKRSSSESVDLSIKKILRSIKGINFYFTFEIHLTTLQMLFLLVHKPSPFI